MLHTDPQWTSVGEPGTRCKNPSVATHPFSLGHVPKDPISLRLTVPGFLGIYLLKNAGENSQTVIQAKQRTRVLDLQWHLACIHA